MKEIIIRQDEDGKGWKMEHNQIDRIEVIGLLTRFIHRVNLKMDEEIKSQEASK